MSDFGVDVNFYWNRVKLHQCSIEKKEKSLTQYIFRNFANLMNSWHDGNRQLLIFSNLTSYFLQGENFI